MNTFFELAPEHAFGPGPETYACRVKSDPMSKKIPWSRNDKLAVAGLAVGLLGIVVALLFPEVRRKLGFEKPALAPLALAEAPKSQLSLPQPQKAPHATTKAKQASP
jgi:hypothetical protein